MLSILWCGYDARTATDGRTHMVARNIILHTLQPSEKSKKLTRTGEKSE